MSLIKKVGRKFVYGLGIKKVPVMTKVEQCRARGVKIGDNVDLINAEIDYCFGHLITIGNNVTITNSVVLAHDASTKKELGYSKIGCVDIGNNVFIGYGSIIQYYSRALHKAWTFCTGYLFCHGKGVSGSSRRCQGTCHEKMVQHQLSLHGTGNR